MTTKGIEPLTFPLWAEHSTAELRVKNIIESVGKRNRTFVYWLQRPMPYHLAIPNKNIKKYLL